MRRLVEILQQNAPWLGAGALLTLMSSFGQTFFISVFAGEIRAEFGLSHGEWGGIYTLGTTASAVAMVWAGTLTDRFRVRALGSVVLVLLASACLFMAWNTSAAVLPLVIFALRFTGQGMASHIAVVAMARWFVSIRGKALSIASLGFAFGEAFLPLIFVSLLTTFAWRSLWVVAAVVCLASIPVLLLLLQRERTPEHSAQASNALGMNARHWTRSECLRHRLFWFMAPALLGPSAFGTAVFFHQVHYAEITGVGHVTLVALFPLFTAVALGATLLSGIALDRLGTARLLPFSQLPMVAAFLTFGLAQSPAAVALGLIFMALTTGANATLMSAFWAEFYGTRHIGAIKAIAAAIMVLGSAIGPGLTGALIDLGMGLRAQYLWAALYFVTTSVFLTIGMRLHAPLLPERQDGPSAAA